MLFYTVAFQRFPIRKRYTATILMKPSSGRSALSYDRPEFFKVFLPNFSSRQLEIPPAFLHHLKGNLPGKAVLKDHTPKSWLVDLEELRDDVFFKNGWPAFVNDHRLEFGDFLIFQYEENCVFRVKIFGKNGCTKEVPVIVDHFVPHVTIKDEPELIQTQTRITTSCDQKLLEVEPRRCASRSKGNAAKLDGCPHFKITISKWCLHTLHVSKIVMENYNIKLSPNLVLQDEKGKDWPVNIHLTTKGRYYLSSGWSNFRVGNNIKVNDKCIFEFVLDRRSICKKIKVKIIHNPRYSSRNRR